MVEEESLPHPEKINSITVKNFVSKRESRTWRGDEV